MGKEAAGNILTSVFCRSVREGGRGPEGLQRFSGTATLMRFFQSSDCEKYIMESLILAQNERWRRVLSMQVERQG